MRIMHIAETIKGGVGTYLNQIVPLQVASDAFEAVEAIVPAEQREQVAGIPSASVVAIDGMGRGPLGLIRLGRAFRDNAARFRPDVVHAHSSFAGLIARTVRLPEPRPAIVYCPHGWSFDREGGALSGWAYAAAERWLSPLADAIVAISRFEQRRGVEVGIDPGRLHLVVNGIADVPPLSVPAPAAPAGSSATLRLLFVGRLDRQKGFDVLLEAVTRLGAAVALRVAGAAVVGAGADSRPLPDNVRLLGWLDEAGIACELATCDVLVVPSRWEGFGLVALEAMRAARPVVASRVGGLPEVVEEGDTGLLFEPGDVEALTAVLAGSSRDRWRDMGRRGRQRFLHRFTADRTAGELLALYRMCLDARTTTSG